MSNTFLISLIIPIKIIFIYLIVSYFRNKKIKEKKVTIVKHFLTQNTYNVGDV